MRVVVGITGATGVIFGIRLLERLGDVADVETHLIMSRWARVNISAETDYTPAQVRSLADVVHHEGDQGAAVSSGSFRVDAMVVAPCSMRTLAAIRHGLADNLITRAADVVLKERRNLCVVPRETPLNAIHLDNMLALARMGVAICPPMPAFYNRPVNLDDVVDHIAVRIIDQLGLDIDYSKRWTGLSDARSRRGRVRPSARDARAPGTTLMWEAVCDDGPEQLRAWAESELLDQLRSVDPDVEAHTYYNESGRVVVIATGHIANLVPVTPPQSLVQRPPHNWYFVRAASESMKFSAKSRIR